MTIRRRVDNATRKVVTRLLELEVRSRRIERGTIVCRRVTGLGHPLLEGLNLVGEGVRFGGGPIRIGLCTTLHTDCILNGPLVVGRYCQVAPRVLVYPDNHPLGQVTTYTNEALLDGTIGMPANAEAVVIGHSVWVGAGAILVQGASVGNGAVVGAGAVVTDPVPPYSIAVGSPARAVKQRLPDHLADVVEASRWWELTPTDLEPYREFFELDLTSADPRELDRFRATAGIIAKVVRAPVADGAG